VWDDPAKADGLKAMLIGIAVRDRWPEAFHRVHVALFRARHDEGLDIREDDVLRKLIADQGLDPEEVFGAVATGEPLATFRKEHEQGVADHKVFGVPTVITAGQSVFIRVMHRPDGDAAVARSTVERLLELTAGWPDLNEFKHTSIAR
jgi:2-hydroxychromene-2-carboxylate isomerase